ncbi:hypothetical protein ACWGJ2_27905 [Streptomyces sp. NPDC054796]
MGPPPPPKGSGTGKVIAIVAASLVGLFILGFGAMGVIRAMSGGGGGGGAGGGGSAAGPGYEVTLPKTLEGGKLTLAEDLSDQTNSQNPDLGSGDTGYTGFYKDGSGTDQLLFAGVNSSASDESSGRDMLDGMEQDSTTDVAVPRRDITPDGAEDPLTCEVLTKEESGQQLTMAVCAWGDNGSGGSVTDSGADALTADPASVDLDAFAERVDGIRDEVRVPAK